MSLTPRLNLHSLIRTHVYPPLFYDICFVPHTDARTTCRTRRRRTARWRRRRRSRSPPSPSATRTSCSDRGRHGTVSTRLTHDLCTQFTGSMKHTQSLLLCIQFWPLGFVTDFDNLILDIYPPFPDPHFTPDFEPWESMFDWLRNDSTFSWRDAWSYWSHTNTFQEWLYGVSSTNKYRVRIGRFL